jgi:hypothetical protein
MDYDFPTSTLGRLQAVVTVKLCRRVDNGSGVPQSRVGSMAMGNDE